MYQCSYLMRRTIRGRLRYVAFIIAKVIPFFTSDNQFYAEPSFAAHLIAFRIRRRGAPGRIAQSVGHLTRVSQGSWVRYPVWQHTFGSPSAFSRKAFVSYLRKYVHEELVNRIGGLSLSRKSVDRITDRPDMTLDVYRGRKNSNTTTTTTQKRSH